MKKLNCLTKSLTKQHSGKTCRGMLYFFASEKNLQLILVRNHFFYYSAELILREIEFLDEIPKTRSGKLLRRVLRTREMGLPIGEPLKIKDY